MDWIESAIREFGTSIGIDDLPLSPSGGLQLEMANGTRVAIEPTLETEPPQVLVSMARVMDRDVAARASCALRRAFFSGSHGLFFQLAVTESASETRMLAVTRLHARSFTAPALFHAIGALNHWLDSTLSKGYEHA